MNFLFLFLFLADIAITSCVELIDSKNNKGKFSIEDIQDVSVDVNKAAGNKCARCWKVLHEVTNINSICNRCNEAISQYK